MKIRMLETRLLCEDGYSLRQYKEGETYDVAELSACKAIHNGWAVYAGEAAA